MGGESREGDEVKGKEGKKHGNEGRKWTESRGGRGESMGDVGESGGSGVQTEKDIVGNNPDNLLW